MNFIQNILCGSHAAELVVLYFSSFEAGIASAISSFKWRKVFIDISLIELLD